MCQRRVVSGELLESAESCVAALSTEKAELASILQDSYLVLKILSISWNVMYFLARSFIFILTKYIFATVRKTMNDFQRWKWSGKLTKYTARYIITWKSDKLITTTNPYRRFYSRDPHLSANGPLATCCGHLDKLLPSWPTNTKIIVIDGGEKIRVWKLAKLVR